MIASILWMQPLLPCTYKKCLLAQRHARDGAANQPCHECPYPYLPLPQYQPIVICCCEQEGQCEATPRLVSQRRRNAAGGSCEPGGLLKKARGIAPPLAQRQTLQLRNA